MKPKQYFYFVGNDKFESDVPVLTGRQIKDRIPNYPADHLLFLEGPGNDPDVLINDDTEVNLEKDHGPRRFFLAPPANFGRQ